ncbi:SIKE family domain-containing protein [Ditylenchus destructor]|uniref:SIKE family domain-containing protein n=1 Tax=Ditylenchus destructor TaxID=166010 RepID=A0AAD4NDP8_9BILA|nr:SIKE family domain-containing protein [Ditylenchus destructor]
MNMGTKSDAVDNILHEMRQHVSGLQDKLSVAGTAVSKSQTVNEKIAIMKEYEDKVSTFNSCWRSKDRKNLVANLQHENRQMMALEEENRQLRFALKEMEDGLHLIMNDYRRVFSGFIRSDLLFDFAKQRNNVVCLILVIFCSKTIYFRT